MLTVTNAPRVSAVALALVVVVALAPSLLAAEPAALAGRWLSEDGDGVIEIYAAADGTFEGRIVGGKHPERLDDKNPDPARRQDHIVGSVILRGMKPDGENAWSGGTIYDPNNGKTYRCKLKLDGDRLDLRGYIGISLIGRTSHWTRVR